MRLVCPNCEAKYEVPDDAIPDTGRDVQCANCGHAWFQMRSRSSSEWAKPAEPGTTAAPPELTPEEAAPTAAEVVADAVESGAPRADTEVRPDGELTAPESVAETVAETVETAASALAETAEPEVPVAAPEVPAAAEAGSGYAVDESVLAILREEAEREASARRSETRPLESQPNLGIEAAGAAKAALVSSKASAEAEIKPSARRDLLPDVEEINSSLRPSEVSAEEGAAADAAMAASPLRRRGFRSGFLAVMTIAILGAALYIAAPWLGRIAPNLADPLASYVSFVDSLRLQLDGVMRSATMALNGG